MRIGVLRTLLASTGALLVLFALPGASAWAEDSAPSPPSAVTPLPPSKYSVKELCRQPSFGSAGCLGLRLVAKTPQAVHGARMLAIPGHGQAGPEEAQQLVEFKEPFPGSLTPAELLGDYDLTGTSSPTSTQTIGIVDAYNDPTAEADLEHYDRQFGLPTCTKANGCFVKINQEGHESPLPASNNAGEEPEAGWALEIATDIEIAHSVCQSCHILLVEADSTSIPDLSTAERVAEHAGATEISNSWGGPECRRSECIRESSAFSDPDVVITVAAGDFGYRDWDAENAEERGSVDYPASSRNVVAVGGTRLLQSAGDWEAETVWNDGGESEGERDGYGAAGGGCSSSFTAQPWQQSLPEWKSVGCGTHRAVSDISADADPYTGVAIYDSTPITEAGQEVRGWNVLGGTSVASPIIASVFALAGGANGVEHPAQTLYENAIGTPASLHDVTAGSNGECLRPFNEETATPGCSGAEQASNSCHSQLICAAHTGYDGPSGLGTPAGIAAFQPSTPGAPGKEGKPENEKDGSEGSGGEGSGGAGASGGDLSSGGEARETFTGLSLPPGAHPSGPSLSIPGSSSVLPILTAASLTHRASTALRHGPAKISRIAFAFTLNVPARVQVTLAEQVLAHGHGRWRSLPDSLAIMAAKGRDSAHLRAHGTLSPGRYRLTLTPLHGRARTLTFQIG